MRKMKREPLKGMSRGALRAKLLSTVAMLLVASTLLVTSSYAWFVMSTAPEVTGIDTQVGANGALEIALLNQESWDDLSKLDMGDIDESAADSLRGNNLTWGNLVDLGDRSYGLSQIILQPARLNIQKGGTDEAGTQQYTVAQTILKTPVYSEDGRIQKLDKTSAVSYVYDGSKFAAAGYGVRAIGTCADISIFQAGMNTAKTLLSDGMSKAKEEASKALRDNGAALASIVVAHALDDKNDGFTADDIAAVRALAVGMQTALDHLESALRQVFAGYVATELSGITDTSKYEAAVAAINAPGTTLASLLNTYPGIETMVSEIETYITILTGDQTKVEKAIADCDSTTAPCSWNTIAAIVSPLVNTDAMTISGKTIDEVKAEVITPDGIDFSKAMALVSGGVKIGVPSGSGILSDIADYAGNYASVVTLKDFKAKGYDLGDVPVTITTITDKNPVYLNVCSSAMRGAAVTTGVGNSSMTDFYGYALDLAFRTNAADSQLLLQTEPENRVYEGDKQNDALQGAGSYMSFVTGTGISANKMVRLMSGIRVALLDATQNVLGIATLDCNLGKDIYAPLTDEIKNGRSDLDYEGMAYYLNASKGGMQQSDLITESEYDALPDKSAVEYDAATGELKAKLYMHSFSMTVSDAHTEEDIAANGGDFYTGGITIGAKVADNAITKLVQDRAERITAVVYIDGSVVTNATVAANAQYSMTGTLNLQFSSDAELMPAQNAALQTDKADYSHLAEAGESYVFEGVTYTVKTEYAICKKSTDPYYVYYHDVVNNPEETNDSHVRLTTDNCTTALEVSTETTP